MAMLYCCGGDALWRVREHSEQRNFDEKKPESRKAHFLNRRSSGVLLGKAPRPRTLTLVQRAPAIYEARTHTLQRAHAHPTFVHT